MQFVTSKTFDAAGVLASITPVGRAVAFPQKQVIFSEGQRSDSIFYIEKGAVKLTVTSSRGKEAIISVFSRGDFFGESCVAPHPPVRFNKTGALPDTRA